MAWGKAYLFQHKYKFRGFQLRTGVFCVLFLLTVRLQKVGAAVVKDYNEACTPDEQCVGNLIYCVNSVCVCTPDTYYHTVDKTCNPKIAHGQPCNDNGPDDQCLVGTCSGGQCICGTDEYYAKNACNPKVAHGGRCDSSIADVCQNPTTMCVSDMSGQTRCLCDDSSYYNPATGVCSLLDNLKVSYITAATVTTNSVTLTWTSNNHMSSVTYEIDAVPSGLTVSANQTGGIVTGLMPGTQYIFKVTSVLQADNYYPEKRVFVASSPLWTRPAKPGAVTNVHLVSEQLVTYDITFGASQGQVSYYTMTVNSETVHTIGSSTTVRFTSLQPGHSCNYSITAYNGYNDPSKPSTGTLKTPVIASGPVVNLMVSDITDDRAKVSWKKPYNPNGLITGYTLTVSEGSTSTCVYGHIFSCSDCLTPGVSGNINGCQRASNEGKTSSYLNGDTTTFTVNVLGLEPYRNYTVSVTADSVGGIGVQSSTSFRTLAAAARDVADVTARSERNSAIGAVSLAVTWTPGYFTGPTNYVVLLEVETNLDSNMFMKASEATVTGYSTNGWTKTDVLAYWNYRVYVLAMTDAGNSSVVGPTTIQTATNVPGLPQNVSVTQDETVAQELTLTITCPREKERNGIIAGYVIRKTLLDATGSVREELEYTVDAVSSQICTKASSYSAKDVDGIAVGHNYTFGVKVKNNDYTGSYSQQAFLYVEPRAPRFEEILQDYGVSSLVRQQGGSTRHQTEIDVSVCASCLLDGRQGTVEEVGLVVCKVGSDDQCIDGVRKRRSLSIFEDFTTWSRARAQGFTVPYRATPDKWINTLTVPNTSYSYRIGTNANCPTTVADTVYCNGPLPTDTRFRVAVIQCNSVGCVIGTFEGPFLTGDDDSENTTLPIVLGVVIPVVIIIAIIIIIVIVIKRRGSEQHKKEGDQRPYNTMNTAMNDAHLYHGVTGRTYVSPPHTNHDGQDNIAMAGLQTHQASLYQRDVTEYTEPDHYDYIGDNGHQNSENQPSQSHDGVGQTGKGEQNRVNPYNNLSAPMNAQGKKDYYNM